jgi:hypothetical protein
LNRELYRPTISERDRNQEAFGIFIGEVLTVDIERKAVTLIDMRSGFTYEKVDLIPANAASSDGSDVDMPEQGSRCYCAHVTNQGGFYEAAILNWILADTNRMQQGIATRAIDHADMGGWNIRKRGTYRKAYAGQKTSTRGEGFTEKLDDGWDRTAADFSRDRLDPLSRTRTQITANRVDYTDSGLSVSGQVNRPGASSVVSELLPDGTSTGIVYLTPGARSSDRYVTGKSDVIPFVEHTRKVQEYALDYPIPAEVLSTALLNTVLGVTGDPWGRTSVVTTGPVAYDNQTFLASQSWDHPTSLTTKAIGPALAEGVTPQRRGFMLEKSEGTLVGSNLFDVSTYGHVLKPVVFPYTSAGRFGADVESGYLPTNESSDHVEARLAASAMSVRFPAEYNTTRWDITKEGMLIFDIGSSLPKENIPLAGNYEYPHGAGRSMEGHLTGSLKLVVGKNRDEEDAIDLQALGQTVLRLGADDTSLPGDRRTVMTQVRSKSDAVQNRSLQYWTSSKLVPGDAGSLANKTGAENVSIRGAFDGATVLRLGARNPQALRRHMMNGYADGPGRQAWAVGDASRVDSKSPGRPVYGPGDSVYAFHDLTLAGQSTLNLAPYAWSGAPMSNMDQHGLSLDVHAVRDVLLRVGSNPLSGQSVMLDTAGGLVAALGADLLGRSITATLDGGVELVVGMNKQGSALQVEFHGDVNWIVNGNFHLNVTGDTVFESATHYHNVKTDIITKAQNHTSVALVRHVSEAPDIIQNQGLYDSSPV